MNQSDILPNLSDILLPFDMKIISNTVDVAGIGPEFPLKSIHRNDHQINDNSFAVLGLTGDEAIQKCIRHVRKIPSPIHKYCKALTDHRLLCRIIRHCFSHGLERFRNHFFVRPFSDVVHNFNLASRRMWSQLPVVLVLVER